MLESIGITIHGGEVNKEEVNRLRDIILFEGKDVKRSLVRFFCLLLLASGIATYGLLGNSVATIIGAMIVAPLMLPIMGLAFGISIGDSQAIKNSLLISLGGIAVSIAIGYLLTLPIASVTIPQNVDQIMIRTSPRILDLLAALVTGLAGAFAMSRSDVSDTLPGVAIAISLVPPLANTGILLATSNFTLAMGSFLLFITNFFAIIITGATLFAVMGFPRAVAQYQSVNHRRKSIALVIVMISLIMVPLAYNGYNITTNSIISNNVQDASTEWLSGSGYQIDSINSENADNSVVLVVIGDGELPPEEKLQQLLEGKLYGKQLRVEVVQSRVYYVNG